MTLFRALAGRNQLQRRPYGAAQVVQPAGPPASPQACLETLQQIFLLCSCNVSACISWMPSPRTRQPVSALRTLQTLYDNCLVTPCLIRQPGVNHPAETAGLFAGGLGGAGDPGHVQQPRALVWARRARQGAGYLRRARGGLHRWARALRLRRARRAPPGPALLGRAGRRGGPRGRRRGLERGRGSRPGAADGPRTPAAGTGLPGAAALGFQGIDAGYRWSSWCGRPIARGRCRSWSSRCGGIRVTLGLCNRVWVIALVRQAERARPLPELVFQVRAIRAAGFTGP